MISSICTSAVNGANRAVEFAHTWGFHQVTKLKSTEQDSVYWTAAKTLAVYTLLLPVLLTGIQLVLKTYRTIENAATRVVQYLEHCPECTSLAQIPLVGRSLEDAPQLQQQ